VSGTTGIGLAPDMLTRVFDLFTQENRTLDRSQGGLGIGLTLVRSLIELQGAPSGRSARGRRSGASSSCAYRRCRWGQTW